MKCQGLRKRKGVKMDYRKLAWESDFMASELGYSTEDDDFVVGLYSLIDFPEVLLYINTEEEIIVEVYLMRED